MVLCSVHRQQDNCLRHLLGSCTEALAAVTSSCCSIITSRLYSVTSRLCSVMTLRRCSVMTSCLCSVITSPRCSLMTSRRCSGIASRFCSLMTSRLCTGFLIAPKRRGFISDARSPFIANQLFWFCSVRFYPAHLTTQRMLSQRS